jgi:hypothetical protein
MKLPKSTLPSPWLAAVLSLGLLVSPAWAEPPSGPTPVAAAPSAGLTIPAPSSPEERALLAEREAQDPDLERFEAGEAVIIIGGSVLGLVLVVIIVVLLLRD